LPFVIVWKITLPLGSFYFVGLAAVSELLIYDEAELAAADVP
jgi:hypothetical protein